MTPSDYIGRGWAVVPIPQGQKGPKIRAWQTRIFGTADFGPGDNIGVKLGGPSNWLADADLDCAEALALADIYLPLTGAVFGRASKPRSHRLYIAPNAVFTKFVDPITGNTILELRADGETGGMHQTLFPPSIADGEQRKWHCDTIDPFDIDARILRRRCDWLAIACLVMRYVSADAARRPNPDLPRLLWDTDPKLGRPAYRWRDQLPPDAPQRNFPPRSVIPSRSARLVNENDCDLADVVNAIRNDCDWHQWIAIGMAIYAASGGSRHGGIVFDNFSAQSPKYDPYTTADRWQHFSRSPPTRTGLGKLIALARQAGWRPNKERA